MHLLNRSQVIARKNDEERVAAKQGMELATRVDGLRKQNLEEEKKLTVNRQLMLEVIAEELENARKEKETIKAEIRHLEEARIRLKMPLTDHWNALKAEQATWNEKLLEIEEWKASYKAKETLLAEQLDLVNENLQSSIELKNEAETLKTKSVIQNAEVANLSRQLSKDIARHTDRQNQDNARSIEREARLNRKEEELKNKQNNLNLQEREFNLFKLRHG